MTDPTVPPSEAERGSVEHYRRYSGSFINSFLTCYGNADHDNRARLARAFPQMAAAMEMDSWTKAPPNFPPDPFAIAQNQSGAGRITSGG